MRKVRAHKGSIAITPDPPPPSERLLPMSIIDEMVARGWGSTRREKIPADWREREGPDKSRRL